MSVQHSLLPVYLTPDYGWDRTKEESVTREKGSYSVKALSFCLEKANLNQPKKYLDYINKRFRIKSSSEIGWGARGGGEVTL